jgi:hypothetical protein
VVATITPSGTNYATYSTGSFNVTSGSHTISFVGLNPGGGNNTAFIDQVNLDPVALPQFADPGFDAPNVGSGTQADPTTSSWSFSGSAGLAGNGSTLTSTNPPAPQGTQVAYLSGTKSSISQTFGAAAGKYSITFDAAQSGSGNASYQSIQILIDGTAVDTISPLSSTYAAYTSASFVLSTAGTHTIEFLATNPNGGSNTALIDQVFVNFGA